jgi:spore germination protein
VRDRYITWPEMTWHVMQFTICANYLFMPQVLYDLAGRSSWLIVIVALLPACLGIWSACALYSRFPDQRIGEFMPKIVGRPLAILLGLLLAGYWYGGSVIDVAVFVLYSSTTVVTSTPTLVLLLLHASVVTFIGLLGIKTLVRVVDLLLYTILPFLVFMYFWPLFSTKLELDQMLPLRVSDFRPDTLQVALGMIGMYHGYHVLFLTGPALSSGRRGAALATVIGTLLAGFSFLVFTVYPLIAFGWPAVADLTFPMGSFLAIMAPPSASFPIRRLDFFVLGFLRLIMTIAAMTYFWLSIQVITDVIWPGRYRRPPAALTLALGIGIVVLGRYILGMPTLLALVQVWMPMSTATVAVVITLAVVAWLRNVNSTTRSGKRGASHG